ncbi:non-ribosomal peptide synthetase [Corynascus similis CBS 632.67]
MGSVQGFERLQLKTAATLPLPNGKTPVAETTRDSGPPSATEEGDLPSGAVTPSTPTTSAAPISEEVLLISWLIVLLRTREDSQFTFEWAYKTEEGANGELPGVMRLSASEVLPDLQSSLEKVASAIASQIGATSSRPSLNHAGPISLLLSTGSLTQISKGSTKNTEPSLHLEVRLDDGPLEARPVWHSEDMLPFTVTRHVETLYDTVKLCLSNPNAPIQSLLGPTRHDLNEIWRWNHTLPPTYDHCMHDVISERAQRHPDKEAISSFDGDLSYGQVDRYSTLLAHHLRTELDVKLHDFVPVCFEKSRWTVVAVLAVMKAGATMVMMDPSLPLARLQNMAEQVGAKAMVSSRKQCGLAKSILPEGKSVVVEEETFKTGQGIAIATTSEPLPRVPGSALMYIIFTSGSTGTPKGVKISHQTYTSSAIPRAAAVGYAEDSRVLDFASYAFDVSIDSMLLTLSNGGCLCIPSDEDRLNDINGAMRKMRVNYAGITPSVARILDLDVIASLTGGLGLGGEAVSARDVNVWGQYARIIIGYGPCECTIGCTVNSSAATGRDYISIGPGNGAAIWVADPNDHEVLMPVGAVGELLVEGPIVGQGYLNDPAKTAAAFIEDPAWLTAGHGASYPGRRGRLYKTGDLGRYDPDGSGGIVFVGRKDTQVKLRGQRVELGEIESQLRARLPSDAAVIAEVIAPQGSSQAQAILVAFISPQAASAHGQEVALETVELPLELRQALVQADKEVAEVLPRYMVPTAYIPVNRIPTLISGKTDRKKLRQFGATVDLRQMTAANQGASTASDDAQNVAEAAHVDENDRPLSEMEQRLRQAWGQTLKLDPETIRLRDNFFALGGDSLAAMRLVSMCRDHGLDLSVIKTFGNPTLSAMAAVTAGLSDSQTADRKERTPFSLIPQPPNSAIDEASQVCGAEPADIHDIYPCTPTQESLFTFSLKSAEPYIAQRVATIPSHISLDAWKSAWEAVVAATPVLRSRLVQLRDRTGLDQVVLGGGAIPWRHLTDTDLDGYLEQDRKERMDLGQSLARYAIVEPPHEDGKRYMVWTLHHAVYDGWSEPLLLEKVRDALQNPSPSKPLTATATMGDFVKHLRETDEAATQSFWREELEGATGPQFPRVPSRDFVPTPDSILERRVALPTGTVSALPFTLATLIRGAWALVASQHARSDDVVFGETLTGRDIPLAGIETIAGPLIATVPVRVRVPSSSSSLSSCCSVADFLGTIQSAALKRTPFQHMGMQNIRRVSRDAQYACEAPTGLVVQPIPDGHTAGVVTELGFALSDVVREAIHFNPYPLMLACGVESGGDAFRVCASFDGSLVSVQEMGKVLAQFEAACVELSRDLNRELNQVSCVPVDDLNKIWSWNRDPPLAWDSVTGTLQTDSPVSLKPGSVYNPRAVVSWVCDLKNPSRLVPIGFPGELWLEGTFLGGGGSVIDSPPWLLAGAGGGSDGRRGKVQPTGNVVVLQEDGSLVFFGRKDIDAFVQGHGVDPAELEVHLREYLPTSNLAAAVHLNVQGASQQELVVLVQQKPQDLVSGSSTVRVLSENHHVVLDNGVQVAICAEVTISLAGALRRLDKFVQNSLASHLVPSAYIVVDKLPTDGDKVDRTLLRQLGSGIPQQVLDQLRVGFQEAWKSNNLSAQPATTTTAQDILRAAWSAVLGLDAGQIDTDDNFFRLGGDSVLAMKLVSRLRAQGHKLTVADIFRHMRLGDAAKVLKVGKQEESTAAESTNKTPSPPSYQPFSMLGSINAQRFVEEVVKPNLGNSDWSIQDAYPVTDSQALDVRATVQPPRTSIQYTMLYSDQDGFDQVKLFQACKQLVSTHDILRTVFIEHESKIFQIVLKDVDIPVAVHRAQDGGNLEQSVDALCSTHIESGAFRMGSPFVHFLLVEGEGGHKCFVIGLSHAQYDGVSLPLLLQHLEALYTDAGSESLISPSSPFSAYMAQTHAEPARSQALAYWTTLLSGSSLTVLPGQTRPSSTADVTSKAIFHSNPVPSSPAKPTRDDAPVATTATILTAAWALVLARRLRTADVTFGSITSGRAGITVAQQQQQEEAPVMGPCYQFTPVRVPFAPGWSTADLLEHVQRQGAESAAHDFVGFEAIAEAVGWKRSSSSLSSSSLKEEKELEEGKDEDIFFDSVVHHQDWDDFDAMPFAGRECKVGILNPHGDAAWPLKVVSFVKGEELHVGVVGRQEDVGFVDEVLGDLTSAVQELTGGSESKLLGDEVFLATGN